MVKKKSQKVIEKNVTYKSEQKWFPIRHSHNLLNIKTYLKIQSYPITEGIKKWIHIDYCKNDYNIGARIFGYWHAHRLSQGQTVCLWNGNLCSCLVLATSLTWRVVKMNADWCAALWPKHLISGGGGYKRRYPCCYQIYRLVHWQFSWVKMW